MASLASLQTELNRLRSLLAEQEVILQDPRSSLSQKQQAATEIDKLRLQIAAVTEAIAQATRTAADDAFITQIPPPPKTAW